MDISCSQLPWYAVNVRSNQEKIADALLRQKGYTSFLPLRRTRSRRVGGRGELELPLFPGYLFCRLDLANRGPIVTLTPVVRVVSIGKTPIEVNPTEIQAIRTVVESGVAYTSWPYLGVGEFVRVTAGPLRGMSGILIGERGQSKVVVSVSLIQRSVAAEVDRACIAPLNPGRGKTAASAVRTRAAVAGRGC